VLEEAEARRGKAENFLGRRVWTEDSEGEIVGFKDEPGTGSMPGGVQRWIVRRFKDGREMEVKPEEIRFW